MCRPWWSSGIVLAIGPNVRGFKPSRGRWIFKVYKILSTTSFGAAVKMSAHVVRFYSVLRKDTSMKEILCRQNPRKFLRQVSPTSLLDVFIGTCRRVLVDESEVIRNEMGTHNKSEIVVVKFDSRRRHRPSWQFIRDYLLIPSSGGTRFHTCLRES
jgi:hypothetical protein